MFKTRKRRKTPKRNNSQEKTRINHKRIRNRERQRHLPLIDASENFQKSFQTNNSYHDYSLHSMLERIKQAKKRMISRRRDEIKSLQMIKNSQNFKLKDRNSRRLDKNWRPRRAISLEIPNREINVSLNFKQKKMKTFLVEKSKIFYKEFSYYGKERKTRSQDHRSFPSNFSKIFKKSKIKKFAMSKGDFYSKLPDDVKLAFRGRLRKIIKCEIDDFLKHRIDSLTNVVVNSLFRAKHLNKFNLIKTPDFLFLQTPNKSNNNIFHFHFFF